MAMLAAAPLLEMGGSALLEKAIGKEAFKKISPMAMKGLGKIIGSKGVHKTLHNIGNKFFGKKHKTARGFLKKAKGVGKLAFGKTAHQLLNKGLDIGSGLGVISEDQAQQVKHGYEKALSLHDKLSSFNKHHKSAQLPEVPEVPIQGEEKEEYQQPAEYTAPAQYMAPAQSAPTQSAPTQSGENEKAKELNRFKNIASQLEFMMKEVL